MPVLFSRVFIKVGAFSTGYPAPRRCHSCVQIRNGESCKYPQNTIQFQFHTLIYIYIDVCCFFNVFFVFNLYLSNANSYMHCVFVFNVVDVFICGGYNGELILADLWKINLHTFQWSKLPAVMPEPAYFHCAAVTPVSITLTFLTSHLIALWIV